MSAFVPDGTWDVVSGKAYINMMQEGDSNEEGEDEVEIWAPPQSNLVSLMILKCSLMLIKLIRTKTASPQT